MIENAFRRIFIAPEGYGLMTADWSQLEQWVMAYLLDDKIGDSTLLKVLQSGTDIHTWAARNIARRTMGGLDEGLSDLEWKTEHSDLRRQAKTFVFGSNYGLTPEGVLAKGQAKDLDEATELIEAYYDVVPGLRNYFRWVRKCILENGYLENVFGQRRHFPSASLLKACNRMYDLEALIREGYNWPIQSGGSTLHSAVNHLTEYAPVLHKRRCLAVISVHDSLTFQFYWPNDRYAETTARIIKDMWEQSAAVLILPDGSRLGWQVPVDVEWGHSWGDPSDKKFTLSSKGAML